MRSSRARTGAALAAGAMLVALLWSARASAFCRTTTCVDCTPPATGCVTEGIPLFWTSDCVTYNVQQAGSKWASFDETSAIADLAFGSWAAADCGGGKGPSIHGQNNGAISCDKEEYNDESHSYGGNANIIVFRDANWTLTSAADPASTLALTTVTFAVASGEIYDADIEINGTKEISTATPVPPTAYDLQSILTHEVGHFLGMAHSTLPCSLNDGNCPTMNAYYATGSDSYRSLEVDDVEGICAAYPANRSSGSCCVPRHGFSDTCGTPTPPDGGYVPLPGQCQDGSSGGCHCSAGPGGAGIGGGAGLAAIALAGLAVMRSRSRARRRKT